MSEILIKFFDLETTGIKIAIDKIIQLSAITTNTDLKIIEKKKLLFNPGIHIPEEATAVHGITDEMVKDCPPISRYGSGLFNYFNNSYLAGYNIHKFDVPLLYEELARLGLFLNILGVIDSMKIFHEKEPRDLKAATKFYTGKNLEGAHDAENDTIATIEILEAQQFMYDMDIQSCFVKSKNVDLAGKIILNEEGIPVWNFGKYRDKNTPVTTDMNYVSWLLTNSADLTINTKNIIKQLTGL